MADVAADLVGPNVVFHHSKLNFKWFDASDTVKWHQDIQFFPHTNYNVITIGCYLADTDMSNGPLAALKGSHNDCLYDQYDADGNWTGMLSDEDAARVDMSRVEYMTGKAGSITIHNARHAALLAGVQEPGSAALAAELLHVFGRQALHRASVADEKTPTRSVRGEHVIWAEHDPRPCQIPPNWSGGYSSIYAAQAGEDQPSDGTM